ncbi:hypothetical protein AcV7_002311 [Taiwanofungus camphoratus]|nr:hypothetical protein AcV7_002311 [Antrodia cinnamomea]
MSMMMDESMMRWAADSETKTPRRALLAAISRLRCISPGLGGLLPASDFLLPTSYFLLPTSYFLLPTTSYFLLPTTCFLLPGVIDANDGARRVQAHSRESRRAPCARHTAPPRSSSNPVCAATTPGPPLHPPPPQRRATELAEGGGFLARRVERRSGRSPRPAVHHRIRGFRPCRTPDFFAPSTRRTPSCDGERVALRRCGCPYLRLRQAIRFKPARKQSFQKLQALLIRLGVAHDSRAADATLCEGDDPLQAI